MGIGDWELGSVAVLSLDLCTEFNVEQLMQLFRCVAAVVVAAAAAVVATAARHADKPATRGVGGRGRVWAKKLSQYILENFV